MMRYLIVVAVLMFGGCMEEEPQHAEQLFSGRVVMDHCARGNKLLTCPMMTAIWHPNGVWAPSELASAIYVEEGDYIELKLADYNGYSVRWEVRVYDESGNITAQTYAQ